MQDCNTSHILKCHGIVKTDFVRGEGCYLYDAQGKRYIDFESGIWCTALGHGHPRVNHAAKAQIDRLIHLGTNYPAAFAEELAVDLLELVGLGDGKCTFLSSGSEAVEFGTQLVRRLTNRPFLLTLSGSYLAAYGSAGKQSSDEWWSYDWRRCGHTAPCECWAKLPFDRIGGFVLEPGGSGSSFVQFPPAPLVDALARRVKQNGGILVANEVTTGMGRTGKWFGYQHYEFQPDIVALGKGLGNGYPVSAVVLAQDVAEQIERQGYRYAQSHQNDPLGCAIARAVIATMREEGWIKRGAETGFKFLEALKRIHRGCSVVKEVRGRGMLLGLELHSEAGPTVQAAYEALLAQGFLVGYSSAGNILRFDPALTMKIEDIDALLDKTVEFLIRGAG